MYTMYKKQKYFKLYILFPIRNLIVKYKNKYLRNKIDLELCDSQRIKDH